MVERLIRGYLQLLLGQLPAESPGLIRSVRPLLDPSAPIYRQAMQDLDKEPAFVPWVFTRQVYSPAIEPNWRAQLAPGVKLDALLNEAGEYESVEGWAVATVDKIEDDVLHCSFDGLTDLK